MLQQQKGCLVMKAIRRIKATDGWLLKQLSLKREGGTGYADCRY
jgi:hypothetical protein